MPSCFVELKSKRTGPDSHSIGLLDDLRINVQGVLIRDQALRSSSGWTAKLALLSMVVKHGAIGK
jgi:hypothetical protein